MALHALTRGVSMCPAVSRKSVVRAGGKKHAASATASPSKRTLLERQPDGRRGDSARKFVAVSTAPVTASIVGSAASRFLLQWHFLPGALRTSARGRVECARPRGNGPGWAGGEGPIYLCGHSTE